MQFHASPKQTHPMSPGKKKEDTKGIKSLQNQNFCVYLGRRSHLYYYKPQPICERRFFFFSLLQNPQSQKSCYWTLFEGVSLCAERCKEQKDPLSLKLATPFQLPESSFTLTFYPCYYILFLFQFAHTVWVIPTGLIGHCLGCTTELLAMCCSLFKR